MTGLKVGWLVGGMGVPLTSFSARERHDSLILGIFSINSEYSLESFSTMHFTEPPPIN